MEEVDFYKLARPVQERFIGSVNGSGLPTPILEVRGGPREPRVWLGLGGASLLALIVVVRLGYGDPTSAIGLQPIPMVALYFVILTGVVAGVMRALALRHTTRSLPYQPGVYAFPIGVIDARRHKLRIYRIAELASVDGPDAAHGFRLAFQGGASFAFHAKDAAHAEQASRQLSASRGQLAEASGARDSVRPKALAALDPLQGVANPLRPSTPIVQRTPVWVAQVWGVSVAAGVLSGLAVWGVRNLLSDEKMFARAKEAADVDVLRAYLAHGRRHADEVSKVLLPRAELRAAEEAGTVEAILAYIKAHPASKIGNEVGASLRKALLVQLEKAKQPGTLTALQDFAKKYPDHHLDAELAAAKHAVYVAALEKYKDVAPDKAAQAFVERLLAIAEKSGPRADVRFHRKEARSMDTADKNVQKNRYYMGVISTPSRYFDAAHDAPREADMAKQIIARFAEAFPADLLALQVGEAVADPAAPLPPVTVPTLFIEHTTEWGGIVITSDAPRGVWAGIGVVGEASFRLPDDTKPMRYKFAGWRRPDMSIVRADPTARPEDKVYDTQERDAFDVFAKKALAVFFKPPPKS